MWRPTRIVLTLIAGVLFLAGLSACGGSDNADAAHALCADWSWNPSLSNEANSAALSDVMDRYDYTEVPDAVVDRAKKQCPDNFAEYDAYVADLGRQIAAADGSAPEVADNGPRQFTAGSFSPDQRANFLVTLRGVEPRLATESDGTLLSLGANVCEAFSNGNSRNDVIKLLTEISNWDGMEAARLTVAADRSLC